MEFTARQIADILAGTIEGDENASVHSVSKIDAGVPGTISFLANPKYTQYIYTTEATIVIVNEDFTATGPIAATLIRVKNAENAFARLLEMYSQVKLQIILH